MHRYKYSRERRPFRDVGRCLNSASLLTPRLLKIEIYIFQGRSLQKLVLQNQDVACEVIGPWPKSNLNNYILFHPESVEAPD